MDPTTETVEPPVSTEPVSPAEEMERLATPELSSGTNPEEPQVPSEVAGDVEKFNQERGVFAMDEAVEKALNDSSGKIGDLDARQGMGMRELARLIDNSKKTGGESAVLASLYERYVELFNRRNAGENNADLAVEMTKVIYDIFAKAHDMRNHSVNEEQTAVVSQGVVAEARQDDAFTTTRDSEVSTAPFMAHVDEELGKIRNNVSAGIQADADLARDTVNQRYDEAVQKIDQWNVPGEAISTLPTENQGENSPATEITTTPSVDEKVELNGHTNEGLEDTALVAGDSTIDEPPAKNGSEEGELGNPVAQVEGSAESFPVPETNNEVVDTETMKDTQEPDENTGVSYYFNRFNELLKEGQEGMKKDATPEDRAKGEAALSQARELARLAGTDATAQVDKIISDLSISDDGQKGGIRNFIPGFRNRGTHPTPEVVDHEIREALKAVATASGESISEEEVKRYVNEERKDDSNRKRLLAAIALGSILAVGAVGTAKAPGVEYPLPIPSTGTTELFQKNEGTPPVEIGNPPDFEAEKTSLGLNTTLPESTPEVDLSNVGANTAQPTELIANNPFDTFMQEKVDMNQNAGTPGDNLWTAEKKDVEEVAGDGWKNENVTLKDGEHPTKSMVIADTFEHAAQQAINEARSNGQEFNMEGLNGLTNRQVAEKLKIDVKRLEEIWDTESVEGYLQLINNLTP